MVLKLTNRSLQVLQAHAERTYPEECCGLLLGHWSPQADGTDLRVVLVCQAVDNSWTSTVAEALPETAAELSPLSKERRYWIDPAAMLAVQKSARDQGMDIIGIYHSHPDHAAVPSECDRSLAWSGYSYVIISVSQGQSVNALSWALDDQHQFQAEPLILDDRLALSGADTVDTL